MLEQLTKRQRALLEQASSSSSNSNGNNEPQRDPECENEASNVGEKVLESVKPSKDLHIETDESAVAETMDYENNLEAAILQMNVSFKSEDYVTMIVTAEVGMKIRHVAFTYHYLKMIKYRQNQPFPRKCDWTRIRIRYCLSLFT